MNNSDNAQLLSVVNASGLRFTAERNHFIVYFGESGRPDAMGFRLTDNAIASAFVCRSWTGNRHAKLAKEMVDCLNRYVPVGVWTRKNRSSQLRYGCRMQVPTDPKQSQRFLGSFVRRQVELISACCEGIRAAEDSDARNPQTAIRLAMRRLQPLAESLPPDQQITSSQWNRALKALGIDAESESSPCQPR